MAKQVNMSVIVGPDGKILSSNLPKKTFRAGGLSFETEQPPSALLEKALDGARRMVYQSAYDAKLQESGSYSSAAEAANIACSSVTDPFMIEPCAMAVFMFMAREIEYRDSVIDQINLRLTELGAEPLDLTHPYPYDKQNSEG